MFALFVSHLCVAQSIYVMHEGDDLVGTNIASFLKAAVLGSHKFTLSDVREGAINIHIKSMDTWVDGLNFQSPKGSASYYSVLVFLYAPKQPCDGAFNHQILYHTLARVGRDNAATAAQEILSALDEQWTKALKGYEQKQHSEPAQK